jgi:hypothetical protein
MRRKLRRIAQQQPQHDVPDVVRPVSVSAGHEAVLAQGAVAAAAREGRILLARHTSHVTRYTSHVTRHTLPATARVTYIQALA